MAAITSGHGRTWRVVGFDAGCCRGQKTPPTEPWLRLRPWVGRISSVGAALAATRPLKPAGFDTSCCRGQKTPPTEPRLWLRRGIGHTPLWERPWPRRGLCCPPASMQAAVGVKTPPTEPWLRLRPWVGRISSVGAALSATRPVLSAGFDAGCCRGQKTPPTEPRLRPPMGRDSCGSDLCGSGLGRDTAVAVRGLRFRLLSRASSLPRNRRQPCSTRSLRWAK